MKISHKPSAGYQQNFGTIYADHKGIARLSKYVNENTNSLLSLNEMIIYQKNKKPDIFLSTDELNNLTAKIGFEEPITETNGYSPIIVIGQAINRVDSLVRNAILNSKNEILSTAKNKGIDEATNQVMNKLKIEI